jgi:hypothetical protein
MATVAPLIAAPLDVEVMTPLSVKVVVEVDAVGVVVAADPHETAHSNAATVHTRFMIVSTPPRGVRPTVGLLSCR